MESQSLDGPIRANRFADSRESPDSRESFQGSRTEPLFGKSRFGALKIANRRFEARESLARYEYRGFLRIDSCESIRASCPDSRCESSSHLSHKGTTSSSSGLWFGRFLWRRWFLCMSPCSSNAPLIRLFHHGVSVLGLFTVSFLTFLGINFWACLRFLFVFSGAFF